MKIEFEVPDWVNPNRILRLFAGQDLIGYKLPNQPSMTKITPCEKCGVCCVKAECGHLIEREDGMICSLYDSGQIPFICAAARTKKETFPNCKVRWESR